MNQSAEFIQQIKYFFKHKSVLLQLIVINMAVFVLVNLFQLFLFLFQVNQESGLLSLTYWLSVPSDFHLLIRRPWAIFTYMFLHEGFFHLLFNMIMLHFSGKLFMEYLSEKQLLKTYILSGLSGALFFVLAYNLFPVFSASLPYAMALGASASVLGVLFTIAVYVPDYSVNLVFIGRVKLKHIAIVFIIIDLLSIPKGNAGGHIAHIGGAFWGFLYAYQLKKGNEIFTWFDHFNWNMFIKPFYKKRKKHPFKDVYKGEKPISDEQFNTRKKANQEKIDKILDKIAKSGYESLSKEEKEILFNQSK